MSTHPRPSSRHQRPATSTARRAARVGGLLAWLVAAGCASVPRAPAAEPSSPVASSPGEAAPAASPAPPAPVSRVEPPPPPRSPDPVTAEDRKAAPAPVPVPAPVRAPAVAPPKVAATPPPAPKPGPPPPSVTVPKPAAPKPSAPPLDLAGLETRLRTTKAIGVMTKLSLKNQVDDLLDRFRAHYRRQSQTTLADLRRPYDMLLLKVLSLLQDSDPPLARDIVASREAIWGILADPKKFNEAKLMAGDTP